MWGGLPPPDQRLTAPGPAIPGQIQSRSRPALRRRRGEGAPPGAERQGSGWRGRERDGEASHPPSREVGPPAVSPGRGAATAVSGGGAAAIVSGGRGAATAFAEGGGAAKAGMCKAETGSRWRGRPGRYSLLQGRGRHSPSRALPSHPAAGPPRRTGSSLRGRYVAPFYERESREGDQAACAHTTVCRTIF